MIGENLKRYRLLKGLSLRKFGELVGMSQTAIMKYEKDLMKPDGDKLLLFANVLGCNVVDLIKDNSKRKDFDLNFRKKESLKGKRLDALKEYIYELVNNYLDVLELNNIEKTKLKKYKITSLDDAEIVAKKFRLDNDINEKIPLSNLCNIIENLGISVIVIENDDNYFKGFDGVSEIVDGVPFICFASDINYYRQRFTLAHELGHLILDIDPKLDEEKICNDFASSLLLPRKAIEFEFGKNRLGISTREYEIVRDEYRTSIKAIIYRLEKCGVISKNYAKTAYINFNKNLLDNELKLSKTYKEYSNKYEQLVFRLLTQEIITQSRFNELMKRRCLDE